jgi:hypothetical protein
LTIARPHQLLSQSRTVHNKSLNSWYSTVSLISQCTHIPIAHSCIIYHNTDFVNIIAESRLCDLYDPRKFMCATEISSLQGDWEVSKYLMRSKYLGRHLHCTIGGLVTLLCFSLH